MPRGGARAGSGRPSHWRNPETVVIRIPKYLAKAVMNYAHFLDDGLLPAITEKDCRAIAELLIKKQQPLKKTVNEPLPILQYLENEHETHWN